MNFKSRNTIIKAAYILIDFCCLYAAIYFSCLIRIKLIDFPLSFSHFLIDESNPYRYIFLFWIIITIFFLNSNNLYQTRREVLEGIEIWHVIKSIFLSSILTVTAIYALKMPGFPRTVFMNAILGMTILLSIWRVIKRWFVEYLVSQGYNNFNALIVGAERVGLALAEEIKKRPGLGVKVIGFLDDAKTSPAAPQVKILGKISDFAEVARREFINKVFITHYDNDMFIKLLEQAREMGIAVRVIPQGFDLTAGDFFKYNIGFIPVLEYAEEQNFRRQAGKRIFDLFFSFIMIVVFILIPVIPLIALLIKLDSRGPVFYRSKRYGRKGRIFYMYKFRSMVQDAEQTLEKIRHKNEVDGPIFKIKKDPRVTKFGCFLRRYSLDELPQLFNVIQGDMSLVGPRPLPIEQIEKEDLRQLKRLKVRPGMTGLWQIRGRSDISFVRLLRWDIWYMDKWSFWLDLYILAQTIPVVFRGRSEE